jgi:hypothetical protein
MTRGLSALILIAGIAACVQHKPETHGVVVYGGGPVVTAVSCPSQSPSPSQFRVFLGSPDPALEAQTGALIFEVQVDSTPERGAQIQLRNETIRREMPYSDSVTRVNVPAGYYSFRARRVGAQTLDGSIEVRRGFVDTVRVLLGRRKLCPA